VWVSGATEIAVYDGAWRAQRAPSGNVTSLAVADRPYAIVGAELRAWDAGAAQWVSVATRGTGSLSSSSRLRSTGGTLWALSPWGALVRSAVGFTELAVVDAQDVASATPGTAWLLMPDRLQHTQY
jgi:hypothetical protein